MHSYKYLEIPIVEVLHLEKENRCMKLAAYLYSIYASTIEWITSQMAHYFR